MGEVYRVCDSRTGEMLALKRLKARGLRGASRVALFEREYHTLAQLAHPRIIEVRDYGIDEGSPYYTMELLEGADLRKLSPLPWRQACAVLRDVASSLAILHSRRLLHRDVSARNVRVDENGRAKLIDFGAMVPMGVPKEVVGTPPFVAPEALQLLSLDARADLFSLGALAYYVLTGRHAFPSRKLADLRDAWRTPPLPPARMAPDVPEPLGRLVLELLSIDRNARPQSAAEVMQRLCAIAELPVEERIEVGQAYLSTPTLVGRDDALIDVRKRMLLLARGKGCALSVEGPAGSGRSRFLDQCVLEAKLLGATVLRASPGDGGSDWGVARTLATQLLDAHPEPAIDAARLSLDVLGHVVPGLRMADQPLLEAPTHSQLLRALRDWVLSLASSFKLVIAVDDVDGIDAPSAAWLAALAYRVERHPLGLVVTRGSGPDAVVLPSLSLLSELGHVIDLSPLTGKHVDALLRSVFGEADNLSLLSLRVHELSGGNPRAVMGLLEHLLDRGALRYEAGSWQVPADLDAASLPTSLSEALAARMERVSESARALAEALSLVQDDGVALADYPLLTESRDHGELFRSLDELVAARILSADADRYRFSHQALPEVLREQMGEARSRALSGMISERLQQAPLSRRVHHLLQGGQEERALSLLGSSDLLQEPVPLEVLEAALQAAVRLDRPLRFRYELRRALLTRAPLAMDLETFNRHLPDVLSQLERDSGLWDYRELEGQVDDEARLSVALERVQARYAETPEHARVLPFGEAIRGLAELVGSAVSIALQVYDLSMLESLPSLSPLLPLSPALSVIDRIVHAGTEVQRGRVLVARELFQQALERIEEPDRAGLDGTYHAGTLHALHYLIGLVEASMGMGSAEEHARVLERDPEHKVMAFRVRVSLHLNQGNAQLARRARRRAEVLQVQDGSESRYLGTSAGFELIAHALSGDLMGVKRATDALEETAVRFPGWRATWQLGRSYFRSLSGDLKGALEAVQEALRLAPAGRHPYFCYAAAAHVQLLSDAGDGEAAVARAREYLAACRRENLTPLDRWVQRAAAEALGRAGELEEARVLIDHAVGQAERLGLGGLSLGALYETRARIAIWSADEEGFERDSARCAEEYKRGHNPALALKFARLLAEARSGEVEAREAPEAASLLDLTQTGTAMETLQSLLMECLDDRDRARTALRHLLQSSDSAGGYLFAADDGLVQMAAVPARDAEPAMVRWLEAQLEVALEDEVTATETAEGDGDEMEESLPRHYTDAEGRTYEPVFLAAPGDGGDRIVAVVALSFASGPRRVPTRELLRHLAEELSDRPEVADG
jgi:hypothetical protein